MKLSDLQRFRAIGTDAVAYVRRSGPTNGAALADYLLQAHGFSAKDAGFAQLGAFLERFAGELKRVGHSGLDVIWAAASEKGLAPAVPQLPASYSPLQQLDAIVADVNRYRREFGSEQALVWVADALIAFLQPEAKGEVTNSVKELTIQSWDHKQQRLLRAVLLCVLGESHESVTDNEPVRLWAVKLLCGDPSLMRVLGVTDQQQTFHKLEAFRAAQLKAEEALRTRIAAFAGTATFAGARQKLMRTTKSTLVQSVIAPLIGDGLLDVSLDSFLKVVQSYIDAPFENKVMRLEEVRRAGDEYRGRLSECETKYSRYFLAPLLDRVLKDVEADFNASALSKPAQLRAHASEKLHPFGSVGAPVMLSMVLENQGAGPALNATIAVHPDQSLNLDTTPRYVGDLAASGRVGPLDFQGYVLEPRHSAIHLTVTMEWQDASGNRHASNMPVVFEAQSTEVPWDEIKWADPYSLDPILSPDQLVGRTELLEGLLARVSGRNVGSFWIWGQKRVGKTSLVRSLEARLRESEMDHYVIYLDAGEFIHPTASKTIERLGVRLCEELRLLHSAFADIPTPEFQGSLAPFEGVLRAARARRSEARFLFIIDEFDELPVELYRYGDVGNALFLSLRSISAKPPFGFVLVGGEKMEFILSTQGDHLNRFQPLRVDYFGREDHWNDFEELIRKPLQPWARFTDSALHAVYEASAGNPFFAKWICKLLLEDMIRRKDSHVTGRDMERGIANATAQSGSNQFQHFWKDGILEISPDRAEERSMRRRRVLLALADLQRRGAPATLEALQAKCAEYGLGAYETSDEVVDFVRRAILTQSEGEYRCNVGLFGRWLVEKGVSDIVTTFTQADAILDRRQREEALRVTAEELANVCGAWSVYKGRTIGEERVRAWLNQFQDVEDQRLMFQLLQHVRFVSAAQMRAKLREIHSSAIAELAKRGAVRRMRAGAKKSTDNVVVTYTGGAGKSGPHIQRLYCDENRIYESRAITPDRLGHALDSMDDLRGLVVIDDFAGTGTQAAEGIVTLLQQHVPMLKDREIEVIFGWVSAYSDAAAVVRDAAASIDVDLHTFIGIPLGSSDRCFHADADIFRNEADRERAREIAYNRGRELERRHPLGFGGCESLVLFEDGCPNNTLPILWKERDGWKPLFPRH